MFHKRKFLPWDLASCSTALQPSCRQQTRDGAVLPAGRWPPAAGHWPMSHGRCPFAYGPCPPSLGGGCGTVLQPQASAWAGRCWGYLQQFLFFFSLKKFTYANPYAGEVLATLAASSAAPEAEQGLGPALPAHDGRWSVSQRGRGSLCWCVPIPNSGVLWANHSNGWSTRGEAREDLWHENTRARRDAAKPMASPAPPSWGAQREPHALHPPCPAPHHGAALGGFLFSPPWEPRTSLTPWPACARPVPPTAPCQARKQPGGARGCCAPNPPGSPGPAGEGLWHPSAGHKGDPDGRGVPAGPGCPCGQHGHPRKLVLLPLVPGGPVWTGGGGVVPFGP